jgi:hypothetical protein
LRAEFSVRHVSRKEFLRTLQTLSSERGLKREVRGVLQEFARMETQREMGRDVLRGFVGVGSEEERCGSEVK